MKNHFFKSGVGRRCFILLISVFSVSQIVEAQLTPASRSFIIGIGRTSCTGSTIGVQTFAYNQTTNLLTNQSFCTPTLNPTFSISASIIDYNPRDQMLYYFRRVTASGVTNTHVWRWAPGTCPPASPAFKSIDTFLNAYLTVAFDRSGTGWMVDLVSRPSLTYGLRMRRVDFTTGTISAPDTIFMPAGVNIYNTNGDYLITPTGTMFFAYNNKIFTIDYNNFGTGTMRATYIDTVPLPVASQNLIGLAYASGEFLGSFVRSSSPVCGYSEIGLLTGDRAPITYAGTFASYDNTSLTSSIGVAKNLVSVTAVPSSPGQYDVAYNVTVSNLGNYPITNTQVIDSLSYINGGAGNVVSASASFVSNPGGLVLNPFFNGTTNANLLAANQTLVNFPVVNSTATIRVNVRLRNIVVGQIYSNAAVATGIGYSSLAIRDSSTNGSSADLNLNEKADDPGENINTPFVITVANEAPACNTISTLLLNQTFSTGTGLFGTMPAPATSGYTGAATSPLAVDRFTITNNAANADPTNWLSMTDHTGNANGRMLIVNADIANTVIYSHSLATTLCSGLKYSFKAHVSNISNTTQRNFCNAIGGFKNPKLMFRVRDAATGLVLTNIITTDITSSAWTQYGMQFTLPSGSSNVILEIINQGEGGCGNDLAIDDIQFGLCDPQPSVVLNTPSAGCLGSSTTMSASLSDPAVVAGTIQYQWQSSPTGVSYSNIASATSSTYTIANMTAANAIYYRVIVASAGNISNVNCRYISNGFQLTLKQSSTAAASISASTLNSCIGDDVILTLVGGSLGTNAVWRWYSNSCGGTLVGTGTSITVNPSDTTTYFVRAEGDCNNTTCTTITVNVDNCVVLPFTVLDLSGVVDDHANRLKFSVIADEQLHGLDILKSADGTNFEVIATLHPELTPNSVKQIEFADTKIDNRDGIFHYRARMRGVNGKVKESQTLVLRRRDAALSNFRVVPNPASVSFTVTVSSEVKERAELRIFDQAGRVVYQSTPVLQQGSNVIPVTNIRTLPEGVYYLSLKSASQSQKTKLMIRH